MGERNEGVWKPAFPARWIGLSAMVVALITALGCHGRGTSPPAGVPTATPVPTPRPTPTPFPGAQVEGVLEPGDNLVSAMERAKIQRDQANEVAAALSAESFPFTGLRPGQRFVAWVKEDGTVSRFDYHLSDLVTYRVERRDGTLKARRHEIPTTVREETLGAVVESSVYSAILERGGTDALATLVSSLFAWDIDFSTDPRKGDTFRLIYETYRTPDGRLARYGRLLAGSYDGARTGHHEGYWFDADDDAFDGFYDPNGQQLRRTFLRAPLDTMRVTSRYGYRVHPILGRRMMHHGVDYGAPRGTPVHAVADGRVIAAGWAGAAGKMVKIQHSAGIVTMYLHLSRIRVKRGQWVQQGTIIGNVGATGRATGPHLDFRVTRNGKFINPAALKMYSEPAKTLPAKYRQAFDALMAEMRPRLEAVEVPEESGADVAEITPTPAMPLGMVTPPPRTPPSQP